MFHGLFKGLTIFSLVDGFVTGPDELHVVLFKKAPFLKAHGHVQRRLATHRGEQRIRTFLLENTFHHLNRNGLDIRPISQIGIGHDRSGITVDEHHFIPFLFQGLAGLGAGIIEFTGLADHNGSRANE